MAIRIGAKADASEGAGRQGGLRWIPIREVSPMPITRLNHAGLYVADLDRSVRFYSDVLGFRAIPMTRDARRRISRLDLAKEKERYGAETHGGIRPEAVR